MIIHIAADLILCLSTCEEIPTGDWDIIDLNLSYHQVILGFCRHWRLPNIHRLTEEGESRYICVCLRWHHLKNFLILLKKLLSKTYE